MIRLFNVSIPPATFILLVFETFFLAGSFVSAVLLLGELDPVDYLLYDYGAVALALVVLSFLVGLHFQNLYTQIRVKSRVLLLQQLCMVTGVAFLAQGLISYIDRDLRVSVPVMLVGSLIAMSGIFVWRLWFGSVAGQMIGVTRLVFIGSGPILTELRRWIDQHPEAGLAIEAAVEHPDELSSLDEIMRKQQPPRIVFSGWGKPHPKLMQTVMEWQLTGYEVESASATYERATGRISLYSLLPEHLVYSGSFAVTTHRFFYQAVLNGLVAGITMMLVAPVLAVTALALRLGTRGPVLASDTVTGLNGKLFRRYRFHASGEGVVARTVRKLQLERLPQFMNVLKGDLTIVGPAAARPEFVEAIERYVPFYRERHSVRPGITGWAQIRPQPEGRIENTLESLEYDLYYIKNRSLGLDTLILLHTLKSMMLAAQQAQPELAAEEVSSASMH
jgi:lipopolysaccharide/colanic/teichoic acid biosynthesis glycosyltransferase